MIQNLSSTLPSHKWIGIFAHPDDEWVAGWPVFQDKYVKKGVIFFVGNTLYGKSSTSCETALRRVLDTLEIEYLGTLKLNPDFYRMKRDMRRALSNELENLIHKVCSGSFLEAAILTHNPIGEYGHPDHITVFDTVLQFDYTNEIYITDLCLKGRISKAQRRIFYRAPLSSTYNLELEQWHKAASIYQKHYRWTGYSEMVQKAARLYKL